MDNENLLKKWLNNDLSEDEVKAFNNLEDASLYREIVQEAHRFSGNINAEVDDFELLENKLIIKKSSSLKWLKIASGIAAILVVGFSLFTIINKDQINSFYTDLAQNEVITLPDNSMVNLNELSELTYNSSDWNEQRVLDLQGEAFFDVEKGKRFDVNTALGKVSVLGTEFNVLSKDSIFKVSCYEGLVQVTHNETIINLPAGKEYYLSSGRAETRNIVISEPYWLKNMSVFENASFIDVIKELIKQYNVIVKYPSDMNVNFTGAFEHDNLENALKSITMPLNLTYTINENNEVIIRNVQN
ncbi:FecR family protein [Winogradskyella tangerina]|uniref:FecR family protein n=1 Tax=Winogradskyella tangerina TaxID=2023240 RepID=UPI000DBE2086|nr:FecR family protein [Winogradskyella tangerina]